MNRLLVIFSGVILGLVLLPQHAARADEMSPNGFYSEYYLETYPDLRATFGHNAQAAWEHYVRCGMDEGRSPNPSFDPKYYMATYPDLRAAFGENNYRMAMKHWFESGIKEGRKGAPDLDSATIAAAKAAYGLLDPNGLQSTSFFGNYVAEKLLDLAFTFAFHEDKAHAPKPESEHDASRGRDVSVCEKALTKTR